MPRSVEVVSPAVAICHIPLPDSATAVHGRCASFFVLIHVLPKLVERYMYPYEVVLLTAATWYFPSKDIAIDDHARVASVNRGIQSFAAVPKLSFTYIYSPLTVADW